MPSIKNILFSILALLLAVSAYAARKHRCHYIDRESIFFDRVFYDPTYNMWRFVECDDSTAPYRSPDFVYRKARRYFAEDSKKDEENILQLKNRAGEIRRANSLPRVSILIQDAPEKTDSEGDQAASPFPLKNDEAGKSRLEKDFTEKISKRLFALFSGRNIEIEILELKPGIRGCSARIKISYPSADGKNKTMLCSAKDATIKLLAKSICDNAAATLGRLESTNRQRLGIGE